MERFDFVERPSAATMAHTMSALRDLGREDGPEEAVTESGRHAAELDMDTMLCRMVLKACLLSDMRGCSTSMHTRSTFLTPSWSRCCRALRWVRATSACRWPRSRTGSVFFRYGSAEDRALADRVKRAQSLRGGDLLTALDAFERWDVNAGPASGKRKAARKAWCSETLVDGKVMSGALKTKKELRDTLQSLGTNAAANLDAVDAAQGGACVSGRHGCSAPLRRAFPSPLQSATAQRRQDTRS